VEADHPLPDRWIETFLKWRAESEAYYGYISERGFDLRLLGRFVKQRPAVLGLSLRGRGHLDAVLDEYVARVVRDVTGADFTAVQVKLGGSGRLEESPSEFTGVQATRFGDSRDSAGWRVLLPVDGARDAE